MNLPNDSKIALKYYFDGMEDSVNNLHEYFIERLSEGLTYINTEDVISVLDEALLENKRIIKEIRWTLESELSEKH